MKSRENNELISTSLIEKKTHITNVHTNTALCFNVSHGSCMLHIASNKSIIIMHCVQFYYLLIDALWKLQEKYFYWITCTLYNVHVHRDISFTSYIFCFLFRYGPIIFAIDIIISPFIQGHFTSIWNKNIFCV